MKKLCTYLTLFVLGLLALAQPAAAADVTFYFKNAGNWTKPSIHWWKLGGGIVDNEQNGSSTPQAMTLVPGTTDVYYKTFTTNGADLTLNQAGLIFTSDSRWGDDISRIEFQSGKVKVGYLYNSDGTMSDAVYTPPVVQTTDYTFYVDASSTGWQVVYLRLWNGDSTWKGSGASRYLEPTETLSNGVKKFVVEGVTQVGEMMFRAKQEEGEGQWSDATQSVDISTPTNGALYTLGSDAGKKSFSVTADYEEPVVKPVVTATPASCTFYGSQSVTLSADKDGAKIYYTTDGTEPSAANGTEYSAPLSFTETTTLKAVAILDGVSSEVLTATYTKGTPSVSVTASSSTFETSLEVTITATPSNAKIYYTTDGTEPSTDGTSYDSPVKFTITSTTTVNAIAVINGVKSEKKEGTFTKVNYSGSLYAKGPAFQGNWGSFTSLSGSNGVFSFDVKSADEFAISSSTEDAGIYMPVGIPTNDETSFPFTVPTGEDNAKAIYKNYVFGKNFKAPAANGKIFIDMNDLKIWYEPKQETLPTELWAKGPGASGAWDTTIKLESDGDGLFHFTAPSAGPFAISDTDNLDVFDNTAWGPVEGGTNIQVDVPTSMPELANVEHKAEWGNDFRATGAGVIWFDAKNLKLWSGERILPTLYTFYVKIDDAYASQWGEDKCYLYTFNEGDDKWTSINGQCVKYDRRLADGVYKFIVRGQTSKGRMLFKNTAGVSDMQEYSGTILPADIKPRALYTISAKGSVTVAPEEYVENNVFEAGKAYYVDASGCSWFENGDCTLGVKYDGDVHYGGTIVKVSSDPLVYRFTVNDDQTEIEVGRRNKDGLHNAVTVQAPTDGSNCIYVKEDNGVLVFDSWGTYSPAGGLYILGSSNTIAGDWKDATPIAMNYDETEGVFYYMVQGTNASAEHPIEFLISRGATNSAFFNAENAFQPVRAGYIHMAESDYMKGKPGYTDGNYFKLLSRGRVMAKYIKAEKSEEITGVKIWYEPVVWPDLYILGSIIADPEDTKDIHSTHEQWETFQKLVKDDKQPGLYYYDLGLGDNENLFNEQPFPVTGGVFGDIDEHGHFNFSFRGDGTDTNKFWEDAFVPATTTNMGTLNRDGVPVPFCYRDSKPDQTGWVSTNFVFGERSRIWVDVVRQLVWIETFTELSGNQVVFDFWDKGGTAYSKEDGYQWWSANDATTHNIQSYLVDESGNIVTTTDSPYTLKPADLSWQALEVINNVGSGVRYHFVANLPESYYEKDGSGNVTDKVANGYHVWIRIKDNANAAHEILRPYAYQATYTQGPNDSNETLNYNYYGNIKAAGAPIVTIEPSVNMIYADVEAPEHLGHFRESHVMHYPYVNQYSTAVTVNDGNVYPFWVEGLTEPAKNESGETIADQYVPVANAPVVFEKSNQVTVSYGSIRETKTGKTGKAVIKGIDHANATADDKMDVRVTYTSPGLIFARTKTEPLKIDATELPTMQTSSSNDLDVAAFYSGTACSEGLTVDLILHQKFAFRDIMTQGGEADGKIYTPRAAYVGYKVNIDADKVNDHSHVAEGHEHMAKNGVPLMWDFTDDHNRDIKGYTDLDKWHYEAYTGKSMAIQLHHAACGKTKAELEGKSVTGSVTFHLYVPVATEFDFETGTTIPVSVRGMHKAGEQVDSKVLGDPKKPYTGSVSAKSYGSFTQPINFSFAGNITTGVEGVGVDEAPVEFYNLQGVRMTSETLAPGIYIRRQGNETSKVYIR